MIFREIQPIGAVIVDIAQLNTIEDVQITANLPDVTPWLHTTNHMHPRVKVLAETLESLQPPTCRCIFFDDSDLETLFAQDGPSKESAQSCTYDDNTF